jgi:acetyl/propionyl-CoA carboxylase alpha subunit
MRHPFTIGDVEHAVWLSRGEAGYGLDVGERVVTVALAPLAADTYRLTVDGEATEILLASDGDLTHVHVDGATWTVRYIDPVLRHAGHAGGDADDVAKAPMPGVAIAVLVSEGQDVALGTTLVVIESMKLETAIKAWRDGTVAAVQVAVGQSFERGAALVTLAPDPGS